MYGVENTHDDLICNCDHTHYTEELHARGSRTILILASNFMPWLLRRWFLTTAFGYKIDPSARIGLAYVVRDNPLWSVIAK